LHVAQQILSRDGFSGFFRGLPPTLIGIIPSRSVYFYAYQSVKHFLGGHGLVEGSPGNALVSGIAAGLCGNTLTNPIWMVRTRMQLLVDAAAGQKAYNGYADAIRTIWKDEGIGGFYKGIFASYWGCAEGALQFIVYEQLKTRLLRRENKKRARIGLPPTERLSEASYFFSAALAKALASVATYPHEVARTRLREQARGGQFIYKGMWQTIGLIGRWEGTAGLYSGMGVHLVKVVPNSAIMFLCYEMVNAWLSKFEVVENGGVPPTRIGS
jgi:solute carrier family 25 protein 33/36